MKSPRRVEPRDLRASDRERENAIEVLGRAYAEGRLTADEHYQRMQEAFTARTMGELSALLGDLPGGPERAGLPELDAGPVSGIFGNASRTGNWVLPARLPINAVVGTVTLDLSTAMFAAADAEVTALCMGGLLHVIAPASVRVDVERSNLVGLTRRNARHAHTEPTATVLVRAHGIGHVSVRTLKEPRTRRRFGRRG